MRFNLKRYSNDAHDTRGELLINHENSISPMNLKSRADSRRGCGLTRGSELDRRRSLSNCAKNATWDAIFLPLVFTR